MLNFLREKRLKAEIESLKLELEHERRKNRILKNFGRSLCAEVREWKYGRKAANKYDERVRSL
jgi:hypothetical protein